MDVRNINKKIELLEKLLKKAELNSDYAISIFGENFTHELESIKSIASRAKIVFSERIGSFEERAGKAVIENWNDQLENELEKFPEYSTLMIEQRDKWTI